MDIRMNIACRVVTFLGVTSSLISISFTRARALYQVRSAFKFEYFKNCDENLAIKMERFSFSRNGTFTYINGECMVSRDIKNLIKMVYYLVKCRDHSNPDTCEYYTTWKWDNFCATLNYLPLNKPLFDACTPPLSCPMKKGHYVIRDAKVSPDPFMTFLPRGNREVLWKIRATLQEGNETIYCTEVGIRVLPTRIKLF